MLDLFYPPQVDERGRVTPRVVYQSGPLSPPNLKRLRDEYAQYVRQRERCSVAALARQCGVGHAWLVQILKRGVPSGSPFAKPLALLKEQHDEWMEYDTKHAPMVVCRREGITIDQFKRHIRKFVRGEDGEEENDQ